MLPRRDCLLALNAGTYSLDNFSQYLFSRVLSNKKFLRKKIVRQE